ncbi:MAG: ABC transporter ATP-binding protein [Deltaproteobacteria bacterium]|nr:ABC transporter ATP-binding protein [Deltaproteobacteria bacterium]
MTEPSPLFAPARSLLSVRDVTKAYRSNRVLRGSSLELCAGELVGVVGENGSGKSTLLEILVGRLGRDGGEVELRGRVGYCPQRSLVFERLTVRENLRFFATAYGLEDWPTGLDALLARYRFEPYLDHLVREVSGGTRQKLNLALALLHDPDVVVLDEPYAGFDLLVVSHFLHDQGRFDRIYTLERGVMSCG